MLPYFRVTMQGSRSRKFFFDCKDVGQLPTQVLLDQLTLSPQGQIMTPALPTGFLDLPMALLFLLLFERDT